MKKKPLTHFVNALSDLFVRCGPAVQYVLYSSNIKEVTCKSCIRNHEYALKAQARILEQCQIPSPEEALQAELEMVQKATENAKLRSEEEELLYGKEPLPEDPQERKKAVSKLREQIDYSAKQGLAKTPSVNPYEGMALHYAGIPSDIVEEAMLFHENSTVDCDEWELNRRTQRCHSAVRASWFLRWLYENGLYW